MGHHECALAQHEIDFQYADALQTADNILTMKYTVKAIAAQHELVLRSCPSRSMGSWLGMHCHQSLCDPRGRTCSATPRMSTTCPNWRMVFIAGQLAHAKALAAVVAPTVNSYKRLVPGMKRRCMSAGRRSTARL